MSSTQRILNAYRSSLRATKIAFNNDFTTLNEARNKIRQEIKSEKSISNPKLNIEERVWHPSIKTTHQNPTTLSGAQQNMQKSTSSVFLFSHFFFVDTLSLLRALRRDRRESVCLASKIDTNRTLLIIKR